VPATRRRNNRPLRPIAIGAGDFLGWTKTSRISLYMDRRIKKVSNGKHHTMKSSWKPYLGVPKNYMKK
jgi:hypothetical protein